MEAVNNTNAVLPPKTGNPAVFSLSLESSQYTGICMHQIFSHLPPLWVFLNSCNLLRLHVSLPPMSGGVYYSKLYYDLAKGSYVRVMHREPMLTLRRLLVVSPRALCHNYNFINWSFDRHTKGRLTPCVNNMKLDG